MNNLSFLLNPYFLKFKTTILLKLFLFFCSFNHDWFLFSSHIAMHDFQNLLVRDERHDCRWNNTANIDCHSAIQTSNSFSFPNCSKRLAHARVIDVLGVAAVLQSRPHDLERIAQRRRKSLGHGRRKGNAEHRRLLPRVAPELALDQLVERDLDGGVRREQKLRAEAAHQRRHAVRLDRVLEDRRRGDLLLAARELDVGLEEVEWRHDRRRHARRAARGHKVTEARVAPVHARDALLQRAEHGQVHAPAEGVRDDGDLDAAEHRLGPVLAHGLDRAAQLGLLAGLARGGVHARAQQIERVEEAHGEGAAADAGRAVHPRHWGRCVVFVLVGQQRHFDRISFSVIMVMMMTMISIIIII